MHTTVSLINALSGTRARKLCARGVDPVSEAGPSVVAYAYALIVSKIHVSDSSS